MRKNELFVDDESEIDSNCKDECQKWSTSKHENSCLVLLFVVIFCWTSIIISLTEASLGDVTYASASVRVTIYLFL